MVRRRRKASPWELLRRKSATLRRGIERLEQELDLLISSGMADPITGPDIIDSEIRKWGELGCRVLDQVRQLLGRMEHEKEEKIETFIQRLSRELSQRGHTVHGESATLIVDGIVHIEAEPAEGRVRINGERANDLNTASLADAVAEELHQLQNAITPPEHMIENMLTAYERALLLNRKASGAQAETAAILLELAVLRQGRRFRADPRSETFRDYPLKLFRADFYSLLKDDGLVTKGLRLRCSSGSDTKGAVFMMVPALNRAAYVGRIWFEKVTD